MKIIIALFAAVVLLFGCAINPNSPPPTVAQVVAQLCPLAQEVGTILQSPGVLSAKESAFIDDAKPVVAKLCAPGSVIDASSLQAFAKSTLPTVLDIVNSSSLPQADKARISAGLLLAQVSIGLVR